MRSLYLGILLAMAIILALSVLVFLGISRAIEQKYFTPVFDAMDEVEVQDAREMLETRGPDAVVAYMHRLNSVFGGSHYLLDANGKISLPEKTVRRWFRKLRSPSGAAV